MVHEATDRPALTALAVAAPRRETDDAVDRPALTALAVAPWGARRG
jgi:hypothetical protein